MNHVMSPTGVAALLLLALVVDYMSIGPNSIRDRIAFFLGLAAIRQGFGGSPLAHWTVGGLAAAIDQLKQMSGSAYIAGASASLLIGAGIGVLAIYTVGALLPDKFSKKLGRFAAIKFPTSGLHRLNYKLWVCAALLGMLGDLPNGMIGQLLRSAIDADVHLCASIPFGLFGVS
jgi:hypothetical protein